MWSIPRCDPDRIHCTLRAAVLFATAVGVGTVALMLDSTCVGQTPGPVRLGHILPLSDGSPPRDLSLRPSAVEFPGRTAHRSTTRAPARLTDPPPAPAVSEPLVEPDHKQKDVRPRRKPAWNISLKRQTHDSTDPFLDSSSTLAADSEQRSHDSFFKLPDHDELFRPDSTPSWTISAGAIALTRDAGDNVPLLGDDLSDPTAAIFVTNQSFDFEYQPGFLIDAIRHGDQFDTQIVAWGVTDLGDSYTQFSAAEANEFVAPNLIAVANTVMRFDYDSDLYNIELNMRRSLHDRAVFVVGARWIELTERLSVQGGDPSLSVPVSEQFAVGTKNDLYGGHVGLDLLIVDSERIQITGFGRVGVFANYAEQSTVNQIGVIDPDTQPAGFSSDANTWTTSLAFEVGLTSSCQITDRIRILGGYRLMWLSQVALAPAQLGKNDVFRTPANGDVGVGPLGATGIDTGDGALFHGGHAAVELSW